MRYLATLAMAAIAPLAILGQHQHTHNQCGTDIYYQQQISENPSIHTMRMEADEEFLEYAETYNNGTEAVQIIPVVVHVMYYNFEDSISLAQVQDAIDVLNEDYSLTNSDRNNVRAVFADRQANMEFQFALAKIDPNGNATTGVTYHQTDLSLGANDNIKSVYNWPNQNYLNVWTVRDIDVGVTNGTVLGYAAFPYNNQPVTDDGIVIRHDMMGRIGTATGIGRTLTHEVGHFLNLYHPFQGGCTGNGDYVSDTPPVASASFGCNTSRNSCSNENPDEPDMIENYMDYADDVCTNSFTTGQKARAKNAMSASLHPLWRRGMLTTASNLALTGVSNATASAAPTVKWTSDRRTACLGQDIQFTNLGASYMNGTTYSWEFKQNGQVIQSSNVENPVMNFTTPGTYTVNFTIANSLGSASIQKTAYLTVIDSLNVHYDNRFTATFENDLPNGTWTVIDNGDGRTWQTTSNASYRGNKSAMNPGYTTLAGGGLDILESSSILLDETSTATLRFRYAWAKKTSGDQDRLYVYVSTDCGESWTIARLISPFQLNTAGSLVTTNFVPTSAQWNEMSVSLNNYLGTDPVLLRFAYQPDGGNNLYLDDIHLDVTIGLEENQLNGVEVYPNPADTKIFVNTNDEADATWNLLNTSGQNVLSGETTNGQAEINIETLPAGVYIVQLANEKGIYTEKIIVQ